MAKVLRDGACREKTGLGKSQRYLLIAAGKFPKPIKLGVKSVGWIESEIDDWIAARAKERDTAARR